MTERARVVVGADGLHSLVARAVDAERYREKAPLLAAYYSYWSGLPIEGRFEAYNRPRRAFAAWPTNDGLTLVIAGWPYSEFESNKADVEGNVLGVIDLVPNCWATVPDMAMLYSPKPTCPAAVKELIKYAVPHIPPYVQVGSTTAGTVTKA